MKQPGNATTQVLFVVAVIALTAASPVRAFDKGSSNIGLTVASGRALDRTYTVFGARLGYFIADGFETAFGAEVWTGNDPHITKLTPEVRYVWFQSQQFKPYAGAFVSRTLYDGLPDKNSYGAKAGAYLQVGSNAYVSAGLVYEQINSCDNATYGDCNQFYPEFTFHVRF
jgi:hypothetical protein